MPQKSANTNVDVFFRHMVGNMRNGVLAIARDGSVVLVNSEACRLFGLPTDGSIAGQHFRIALARHPDVIRVLGGAFEMATLPNRAELRLKSTNTAIGYTLSLVRDDEGHAVGAALLFTFGTARGIPLLIAGAATDAAVHVRWAAPWVPRIERAGGVLVLIAAALFLYQSAVYAGLVPPLWFLVRP